MTIKKVVNDNKKTVAFKKNMLYNTFLMNSYACVAQLARATDS